MTLYKPGKSNVKRILLCTQLNKDPIQVNETIDTADKG